MDADVTERAQCLLRGKIDWDLLLWKTWRHRVAPLLYPNLTAIGLESIPSTILDQLRYHVEINAVRNLLLASHLINSLSLLTAYNLPAVPFKGPVLAASIYHGLERRESGDLDILVHQKDIVRARDILMAHGYEPKEQGDGPWHDAYLRYTYESQLVHPDDEVCIDLHWRLTGNAFPFRLRPEYIWQHLQPVTLLGTTLHTLQPDDLLLYLCVHGAKHFWCKLGWICDIAELVRNQPAIVSESLIARAQALGSERLLFLGLVLAQRLLGIPLPDGLSQQLQRNPTVMSLAEQMQLGLFDQTEEPLERTEALILKFRMRERFRDRGRQSLHWLTQMLRPNQLDRALMTLPTSCSFLYYWLRPIRLMRTYGMAPFRQLRRIPAVLLETLR